MSERKNLCVLAATIPSDARLAERLGADEAAHALDRCMRRLERAIDGNGGDAVRHRPDALIATFERCDAGALAACEMLERMRNLPPLSGSRQTVCIGLHYGVVEGSPAQGEGVDTAQRLATLARPEQALASGPAIMLLTPAARHAAMPQAIRSTGIDALGMEVFTVGQRVGMVTSLPPTARLSQRLRLRHQQDTIFVEEQRPVLLLGRELGNDVVIMDPRASRQHARIERRREGFILVDESSNGTYVSTDGAKETCVKHGELPLLGPGRIGCGFSAGEIERDLVFFDIV
ncbi:MAG: FHA domain-containing protein [Betaproteobacteria bacterium]|nr:MAG: FHA domain-containing protein [Betaproteobacteria bacterium]